MEIYPKLFKKVIYPLIEIRKPSKVRILPVLNFLRETQWWSFSNLKELQQNRLVSLIKHAYEDVPYYHKIFIKLKLKPDDIKSPDGLQKLPILTKEDIKNNFDNLIARNYPKEKLIPSSTSGSTGEPMRFFVDKECHAWNMAAAYREWRWAGYNLGDKMAYLWGAPQDLSLQGTLKAKINNSLFRTIYLDAYNMSKESMDRYIKVLRKFKPKIINAYASAIYLMAQYIEKKGIDDIRPNAVLTSCEMLFDYQREIISRVFGCEVLDYYSGRDTTLHVGECPEHSGYHLAIENAVVEFVKNNKHVLPGELGKIIITDLCNYAMPFIRYEIGDLGVPLNEMCPCGRGLPLMKSIEGRATDILRRSDGGYIASPGLTVVVKDFKNIKQIQIIQRTRGEVTLKVVKGENYTYKDSELLKRVMKRYLGDEMGIKVSFVESIPRTRSGKYRFAISEIPVEF